MELLEQNGVVGGDLFPFGCRSTFCLYYEARQFAPRLRKNPNNWDFIKAAIAQIMAALDVVTPGSYGEVEIPE
jgi:hypothetical protein